MNKITLSRLKAIKAAGERFAVLTAYDATFANLISNAGVEVMLVGDSLGMVLRGYNSTVPVTMQDIIYHVQAVSQGNQCSLIMADLPYMSYATENSALENSAKLMQAGAQMVKLEGGAWLTGTISRLAECGIPVCAHVGLTPQTVDKIGGYRVQGKEESSARRLLNDALKMQEAGADLLLMECIPRTLASEISSQLEIPTIGIGAGPDTTAQVLVLHDMLGIATDYCPKFVKNFLAENSSVQEAIAAYASAVKEGKFPTEEHCYI